MTSNMCKTCHEREVPIHTLAYELCYSCFAQYAIGKMQELENLYDAVAHGVAAGVMPVFSQIHTCQVLDAIRAGTEQGIIKLYTAQK